MSYSSLSLDLKRILRVTKNKIKIGEAATDHLSTTEAQAYLNDEYGKINEGLQSLGYVVPLAVTSATIKVIEQNRAAYKIYVSLFPTNNPNELPDAVQSWWKEAAELWEKIESKELVFAEKAQQGASSVNFPVYEEPEQVFDTVGVRGIGRGEIEV